MAKTEQKQRSESRADHRNNGNSNSSSNDNRAENPERGRQSRDLRDSPLMAYLLDNLEKGTDIGHYGRLTFAMIARHFMNEDQLVKLLAKQPGQDEDQARAMVTQVQARDYNPPRRERILEWQSRQDFPICPNSDDPDSCNVYSELQFPEDIYENINDYYEEKSEA